MSTDYTAVLLANYPGAQWTLNGDTYDGLEWLDDTPKPTQAELDTAWPAVQKQVADEAAAKIAKLESARQKLAALGLDAEEVSALFGI
jgi:hypothetical protein